MASSDKSENRNNLGGLPVGRGGGLDLREFVDRTHEALAEMGDSSVLARLATGAALGQFYSPPIANYWGKQAIGGCGE